MTLSTQQLTALRAAVARATGVDLTMPVRYAEGSGLQVDWQSGGEAVISCGEAVAFARGCFLLTRALQEGTSALRVREEKHFAHCGAMLDMSRNGVMTVEAVKRWIDLQASLGLNLLMLYTEDTYEIPERPYFGYLRGRYTQQELKELDAYALSLGVELVPCIQTLGHLKQFLQWPSSAALRDQEDVLLIDGEETYAFLEDAIRSAAACFTSRRIHIGMDEAHGVGLGAYLRRHGFTDRFALLCRHLDRVTEICSRYGFRPMMWSDMFFRLGSKTNTYYDPDLRVPEEVIESLPAVEQVYWDYYHTDEATYERLLAEHARMGRGTVFAGGVWAWSGFLPNGGFTLKTMEPALRVNARRGTDTVIATLWGDDGAETDYLMSLGRLPLFSEACWEGEAFSVEESEKAAACVSRRPWAVHAAYEHFYDDGLTSYGGKKLLWCDPLYPTDVTDAQRGALIEGAKAALAQLRNFPPAVDTDYARQVFLTLLQKARFTGAVRKAYLSRDLPYLALLAESDLPDLAASYQLLMERHRALWEQNRKRFGWEVLLHRYGGAIARIEEAQRQLQLYLSGELSAIEELEAAPLPDGKGFWFDRVYTPSAKT